MDQVLADLERGLPIDSSRVYASGFSNGAGFAARLAADRSTVIAAAAFSAESLPFAVRVARPVPTWMTVGTLDDRILAQAGLPELPLEPARLLCRPDRRRRDRRAPGDRGRRPARVLDRKRARTRPASPGRPRTHPLFRFTALAGLGHAYPHVRNNAAHFEAAREYWEFFLANPLR